ncbi:VC0807 family protein [Agaribacterium haliotis]|uniref:VC0807 family protein n=1 Tax=Agaribacterium haliotis TaxID=2013869 RepID=UPI000BB55F7A|nr:VC0807 family protein [Agaribacterium haliotis]
MSTDNTGQEKQPKKESLLLNLLLNIIIPTLILTKFSGEDQLGPKLSIVVALAFPIVYGVADFFRERKINFFSALGVISVFLTGGISLLELPPQYIAIKEAAIPALIGIATLISTYTPYPLVKVFLYNDKVLHTQRIAEQLKKRETEAEFESCLVKASYIVAASFFLSSVLNYVLAKMVVVSAPGTEAFAEELGKMTAYSYVVIVVPSIAVMLGAMIYLFKRITRLTGLELEDVFHEQK